MSSIDELPHRLWLRVVVTRGGCWEYTGRLNGHGYGRCTWRGQQWYTHRLVYTLLVATIPHGWVVDHLCLNRACCNPAHLEAVTPAENSRRTHSLAVRPGMLALQRERKGQSQRVLSTHCRNGHEYPEDAVRSVDGSRKCWMCVNVQEGRPAATERRPRRGTLLERCVANLHDMTPGNVVLIAGGRRCRACRAASTTAYRRRRRRREVA